MHKEILKSLVLIPFWAITTYVFHRIGNARSFDIKRTEFQRECERQALRDTVNVAAGYAIVVASHIDIPREWQGWPTAPFIFIGFCF